MAWIPPAHSPFELRQALRALRAGPDAVGRLEGELRSTYRAEAAVLTASGTHALQLGLRAALDRIEPAGRSVALPAYSCFDLVTATLAVGARVGFYDVDPHDLGPDPDSLERVVARGARIVVAASLFGFPLDWSVLRRLREMYGAVVIEDAAQGLGSIWEGRSAGTMGDYTVLSFARGKGWTGSGGGALLARDGHRIQHRPLDGPPRGAAGLAARAVAQWALTRPALYGIPAHLPFLGLGETRFQEPTAEAAIHAYQASLALQSRSLARLEVARRRDAAVRIRLALQGVPTLSFPQAVPGGSPGWLRMPVRVEGGLGEIPVSLAKLGVYGGYPRVLPDLPQTNRLVPNGSPPAVPGARQLVQELVTIPTHGRAPIDRLVQDLPGAFRLRWRR